MIRRLLAPALLLMLAACASEQPRGPDRHSSGRFVPGEVLRPVRLFISPSGEPFRGEDGLGHWIEQADTDHDGGVSPAEFRADAAHAFKVFDTNGDGMIDGFEQQHYERDLVPEIGVLSFDAGPTEGRPAGGGGGRRGGGRAGRGGGGMGGGRGDSRSGSDTADALAQQQATRVPGAGREGAARYSLINEPEPIAAGDADLDGKVTLKEWMAITDRRFARLDHDKSGRLTKQNLLHLQPKAPKAP